MAQESPNAGEKRSFDEILRDLEGVVASLETGELPLEEALGAFERGVTLAREGERILGEADRRVEVLLQTKGGGLRTEPFSPEEEQS